MLYITWLIPNLSGIIIPVSLNEVYDSLGSCICNIEGGLIIIHKLNYDETSIRMKYEKIPNKGSIVMAISSPIHLLTVTA